ncbi:hypothetical protein WL278_03645 [Staphylococcus caprae]|uniref:hypothetical protein n=1 Tax=Staphylococcus TaxID=1279 RepID=UPI0004A0B062|nr:MULTISPECIES: hypothetical protein [Staphylococcus]KDE95709.1 membrane protein [Staphylococcus sp. TE8]MBU5271575.1 hypothetical protein [Staphylococcus caprae]OHS36332.1 hypothetical protein HMPREF3264_09430 [Staphylococcus sp. HMSC62A08]
MPTITEIGHQQFKLFINNNKFQQHVKKEQENMAKGLIISLLTNPTGIHQTFIQEVIQLTKKYYLYCDGRDILLITKDFKAIIKFNIRKPNPLFKQHFNTSWIIEIDNLNSLKKGHGKMLLKDILAISTKLNIEACLWTESDDNTKYFERYKFESIGKIGKDNENLMIRRKERV